MGKDIAQAGCIIYLNDDRNHGPSQYVSQKKARHPLAGLLLANGIPVVVLSRFVVG